LQNNHPKYVTGSYQLPPLPIIFSKDIIKAVSNSKNESIQKNSFNERGLELVENELKNYNADNLNRVTSTANEHLVCYIIQSWLNATSGGRRIKK
jgi:hypothetical protein